MRHYLKLMALIFFVLCGLSACTSFDTKPIQDANGRVIMNSIASLERIKLGGVDQWILVRGHDTTKPLLLKLHGGPGQAEMATVGLNRLLEKDFVVVEWDQRGAGKSSASVDPKSGMNLNQLANDTIELSEALLKRFNRQALILVGHSWGSVVGLTAVQKRPELYQAFVSTGQIANYAEGLRVGYGFLISEAALRKDNEALRDLKKIGPPPYVGSEAHANRETHGRLLEKFGLLWRSSEKFNRVGWMISAVEYGWLEKLAFKGAANRSFELLLPDLLATNLATTIPTVHIPVYFVAGRYDYMAPTAVSQAYFSQLIASKKEWIWFEQSAHFPQWEEVEKFHELLVRIAR